MGTRLELPHRAKIGKLLNTPVKHRFAIKAMCKGSKLHGIVRTYDEFSGNISYKVHRREIFSGGAQIIKRYTVKRVSINHKV